MKPHSLKPEFPLDATALEILCAVIAAAASAGIECMIVGATGSQNGWTVLPCQSSSTSCNIENDLHGGEEGYLGALDKIAKAEVNARLKEIKNDKEAKDEAAVLKRWLELSESEAIRLVFRQEQSHVRHHPHH